MFEISLANHHSLLINKNISYIVLRNDNISFCFNKNNFDFPVVKKLQQKKINKKTDCVTEIINYTSIKIVPERKHIAYKISQTYKVNHK